MLSQSAMSVVYFTVHDYGMKYLDRHLCLVYTYPYRVLLLSRFSMKLSGYLSVCLPHLSHMYPTSIPHVSHMYPTCILCTSLCYVIVLMYPQAWDMYRILIRATTTCNNHQCVCIFMLLIIYCTVFLVLININRSLLCVQLSVEVLIKSVQI